MLVLRPARASASRWPLSSPSAFGPYATTTATESPSHQDVRKREQCFGDRRVKKCVDAQLLRLFDSEWLGVGLCVCDVVRVELV